MQGKSINGFELKKLLGTGGMAEVWYAENEIGMKAAVKILSEELSHNVQMRDRFLNEAKVMVQLDHPNIRKVHGYGNIDGRPAIIMEYLDGSDLKARMKRGQHFTDEELRKWWNQVVDALNYTHALHIVHRDIKPSNIFIDQKGDAKLLDFGIAKVADTTSGTLTGSTLGTRIYMSPEQVKDPKRVGTASDVYSLAVSFVHLLTGKAPYDSTTSSDYDIQVSIVTKPVDMSKVPEEWSVFLTPYLIKEADQRPVLKHFETVSKLPYNDDNEKTVSSTESLLDAKNDNGSQISRGSHRSRSTDKQNTNSEDNSKHKRLPWLIGIGAVLMVVISLVLLLPRNHTRLVNYQEDSIINTDVLADTETLLKQNNDPVKLSGIEIEPTPLNPDTNAKPNEKTQVWMSGEFSVSSTKKVCFSKGNLQYRASNNTWRFAENQWDYIGEANKNIGPSYEGWIDLFCWGTSGWNSGAVCYQPYSVSENKKDYYPGGSWNNSLTGDCANADWGVYNAIINGGNKPGMWRTLSEREWEYVIEKRKTSSGIRYAKAVVNNVAGVILVPDNWNKSVYTLNRPNQQDNVKFKCNMISASTWDILEQAGCVFLPAAGSRRGIKVESVGSEGEYWTSTCSGGCSYSKWVEFNDYALFVGTEYYRFYGKSVRLVQDIDKYTDSYIGS